MQRVKHDFQPGQITYAKPPKGYKNKKQRQKEQRQKDKTIGARHVASNRSPVNPPNPRKKKHIMRVRAQQELGLSTESRLIILSDGRCVHPTKRRPPRDNIGPERARYMQNVLRLRNERSERDVTEVEQIVAKMTNWQRHRWYRDAKDRLSVEEAREFASMEHYKHVASS